VAINRRKSNVTALAKARNQIAEAKLQLDLIRVENARLRDDVMTLMEIVRGLHKIIDEMTAQFTKIRLDFLQVVNQKPPTDPGSPGPQ
jgi:hypothetical protein